MSDPAHQDLSFVVDPASAPDRVFAADFVVVKPVQYGVKLVFLQQSALQPGNVRYLEVAVPEARFAEFVGALSSIETALRHGAPDDIVSPERFHNYERIESIQATFVNAATSVMGCSVSFFHGSAYSFSVALQNPQKPAGANHVLRVDMLPGRLNHLASSRI